MCTFQICRALCASASFGSYPCKRVSGRAGIAPPHRLILSAIATHKRHRDILHFAKCVGVADLFLCVHVCSNLSPGQSKVVWLRSSRPSVRLCHMQCRMQLFKTHLLLVWGGLLLYSDMRMVGMVLSELWTAFTCAIIHGCFHASHASDVKEALSPMHAIIISLIGRTPVGCSSAMCCPL